MIRILLLLVLVTGCESSPEDAFKLAKANPEGKVCFNILSPEHLRGNYCLEYNGAIK